MVRIFLFGLVVANEETLDWYAAVGPQWSKS